MQMTNIKDFLMKINDVLHKVENVVLVLIMTGMTILLVANVFGRLVLNSSLQFAEEAGSLLLVSVCYIGSITAVRKSKHIRMVLLSDRLSFKGAYILNLINQIVPGIAFVFFGYLCFKIMLVNMSSGRTFMTFGLDRWIIWVPVVVGLIGTGLQYFLLFFYNIVDRKNMKSKEDIWIGTEMKYGDSTAS